MTNPNTPIPDARSKGADQVAYRPAQAAKVMGISRSHLYDEMKAGRIKARKVGAATLIPSGEIDRWLAQLPEWRPRFRGR